MTAALLTDTELMQLEPDPNWEEAITMYPDNEDMNPAPLLRHTVGFGRKVGLPSYSNVEASLFLQFEMPAGSPIEDVIAKAEATWSVAAAAVYDRLGVAYTIDENTGNVVEDTTSVAATQMAQEMAASPAPAPAATGAPGGDQPPHNSRTRDKQEKRENILWAKARYQSHPNEFWDNRQSKIDDPSKSTHPDFKHKSSGVGFWLN